MPSRLWNLFGRMGTVRVRPSIGARLAEALLLVAVCTVGLLCARHGRAETQQSSDAIDAFLQAPSSSIAHSHARAVLVQTGKHGFACLVNSPQTSLALLGAWHRTLREMQATRGSRAKRTAAPAVRRTRDGG